MIHNNRRGRSAKESDQPKTGESQREDSQTQRTAKPSGNNNEELNFGKEEKTPSLANLISIACDAYMIKIRMALL